MDCFEIFRVDLFSRKGQKFAESRNFIHAKIYPRKVGGYLSVNGPVIQYKKGA